MQSDLFANNKIGGLHINIQKFTIILFSIMFLRINSSRLYFSNVGYS